MDNRIENVYQWLCRDCSNTEEGAPNPDIMIYVMNEIATELKQNGKNDMADYVCKLAPFYSDLSEKAKSIEMRALMRKNRKIEEEKHTSEERNRIRWEIAKAYCMEEDYGHAYMLVKENKISEALRILIDLSQQGHYFAKINIANIYIAQGRYSEAALVLHDALLKSKNEIACVLLGNLYLEGKGVILDKDTAYTYYEKAAEMGSIEAMKKVAEMNYYGQISHPSFSKATEWFKQAAQRGDQGSIYMSGICKLFRNNEEYQEEDERIWKLGIEDLKKSEDTRAKQMLHYAMQCIPHRKEPPKLSLREIYEKLSQEL